MVTFFGKSRNAMHDIFFKLATRVADNHILQADGGNLGYYSMRDL